MPCSRQTIGVYMTRKSNSSRRSIASYRAAAVRYDWRLNAGFRHFVINEQRVSGVADRARPGGGDFKDRALITGRGTGDGYAVLRTANVAARIVASRTSGILGLSSGSINTKGGRSGSGISLQGL